MPFTFSHPAIILPLAYLPKRLISLTGLVIGSLTPDFEYFLRMKIQSNYSHTLYGLFWFDLPLGLMLAFIFHNLIRESLFENLPIFLKSRFSPFRKFNWNIYFKQNWLVVAVSVLIGASSHILWDSFTHNQGYFVKIFPALNKSVQLFSLQIHIVKVLQHSSTLIGGFVIAYVIHKLPSFKVENERFDTKYWLIIAGLTFVILAMRFINGLELTQYGSIIVSIISAMFLSLILTPNYIEKDKINK